MLCHKRLIKLNIMGNNDRITDEFGQPTQGFIRIRCKLYICISYPCEMDYVIWYILAWIDVCYKPFDYFATIKPSCCNWD